MSAEIRKPPFSRTTRISITADRMTVAHILEFADALREDETDPRTFVIADHSYSTHHFCGLSASYQTTLKEEPV